METVFNILDFGAVANARTDSSTAIQKAIDLAHSQGGGTVCIPAGQCFMSGSLELRSYVNLHLEPGSRLLASPEIESYANFKNGEGALQANFKDEDGVLQADFGRFWIWSLDAVEISITGQGCLDGNSDAFVLEKRPENTVAKNPRAQSLVFFGSKRVRVRDILIKNAPSWALRPCGCEDVVIDGITIDSDLGLVNTDGIDTDCSKQVMIRNCNISCGDDGICIKTRKEAARLYGASENIIVSGCVVRSSCAGIKIGTESNADIRNVIVSDCIIRDSHRGIGIDGRDEATVENVSFSHITVETKLSHPVWWHEGEPIHICPVSRPEGGKPAQLRNIRFKDIQIKSERGCYIQGVKEAPPEDLSFENVRIQIASHSGYPVDQMDPRPCHEDFAPSGSREAVERTPWGSLWKHDCPAFFVENVNGLRLKNLSVEWKRGDGDLHESYSHALETWGVQKLRIEDFQGTAAREDLEKFLLNG